MNLIKRAAVFVAFVQAVLTRLKGKFPSRSFDNARSDQVTEAQRKV